MSEREHTTGEHAADFEAADEEERAAALALARALDAVDSGGSALDDLPNVYGDESWLGAYASSRLVDALGARAELSSSRAEALWQRLEPRLQHRTLILRRRHWAWRLLWSGVAAAALAGLFFVAWSGGSAPAGTTNSLPSALAELERRVPEYAARLVATAEAPRGDTKLRELRNARSEAWRRDTGASMRSSAGVNR